MKRNAFYLFITILSLSFAVACNNAGTDSKSGDNKQGKNHAKHLFVHKSSCDALLKNMGLTAYQPGFGSSTAVAANVQFGKPIAITGTKCNPGGGICAITGLAPVQVNSGIIPPNAIIYMAAGGYLFMNIHLDSLKYSNDPNAMAMYDSLVNYMSDTASGFAFSFPQAFLLPANVCMQLGIGSAGLNSGLYNPQTGLFVPANTFCTIYCPDVDTMVSPIDSEYIQIMFYGLFDTTANNGNTVNMLLGSSTCDNKSPGICSFRPLSASGNPVWMAYSGNVVFINVNYNNLIAAQPNMAQYFTVENGFVTAVSPDFQQTEDFVFSDEYSYINKVPTGTTILAGALRQVTIIPNTNWIFLQYNATPPDPSNAVKKSKGGPKAMPGKPKGKK